MASLFELSADDRALHPLLVGVFLVVVVVVFTATAYAFSSVFAEDREDPPRAAASADAQGTDGQEAWIEVFLTRTEEPIAADELTVTVTGPDGEQRSQVCRTPSLADEACREPLNDQDTWTRASALWIPCLGDGGHDVTVTVRGVPLLATLVDCGSSPPEGAVGLG